MLTNEEFIERLWKNNKYYRRGDIEVIGQYTKMDNKIKIKNKYGVCYRTPSKLLRGNNSNITTAVDKTSYWINQAREVHGDKYDYSKTSYEGSQNKVEIICPLHGSFLQKPAAHLYKHGCGKCNRTHKHQKKSKKEKRNEDFISKIEKIHGDKYDYSKIKYLTSNDKVTVICKKHGEFRSIAQGLLKGKGCRKCGIDKVFTEKMNVYSKKFLKTALFVHGTLYDYSKVNYINAKIKVEIICKKHGVFKQDPSSHLSGRGCPNCKADKTSARFKETPCGWGYSEWEKASKKSKYFDSYKVYIIKCWNEEEEFYKIGRTYRQISDRFGYDSIMPYQYEVVKIIKSENAIEICELERALQCENREYKYVPIKEFVGMYECFSEITGLQEDREAEFLEEFKSIGF